MSIIFVAVYAQTCYRIVNQGMVYEYKNGNSDRTNWGWKNENWRNVISGKSIFFITKNPYLYVFLLIFSGNIGYKILEVVDRKLTKLNLKMKKKFCKLISRISQ